MAYRFRETGQHILSKKRHDNGSVYFLFRFINVYRNMAAGQLYGLFYCAANIADSILFLDFSWEQMGKIGIFVYSGFYLVLYTECDGSGIIYLQYDSLEE